MIEGEDRELFARSLRHATEQHTGTALDAELESLGWADALGEDRRTAVSLLFELQGAAAPATSSALDRVLADALGLVDEQPTAGVVLPALGDDGLPGEVAGESLAVRGLGTAALARSDTAVVATATPNGTAALIVDTSDLALRPVSGLDPLLGMVEVTGGPVRVPTRSEPPPAAWESAVSAGRLALAHELVGASRAMLELARVHALERVQFDRPIAGFQAVRHRLAESLVAIEAADAAASAAWRDGSPLTAALAKAVAGRSARTVRRHAQQVLAGIGFTAEHPLHTYVRRTIVLDQLLGDSRRLTQELGEHLLATRQIPALLPL